MMSMLPITTNNMAMVTGVMTTRVEKTRIVEEVMMTEETIGGTAEVKIKDMVGTDPP
jgi:hypothetical protein